MTDISTVVDQAVATAVSTVLRAAIDRGIDGADVRTTLLALERGGMRDVLTYSFVNRSWMADEDQERHSISKTLARISRAAMRKGDTALQEAAEHTSDLVDKYKPATYDDVRAGLDAADKLLDHLGYDEPSVRKAREDDYSQGWWGSAAKAMEKALGMLEDDTLRAALPEDSQLQLDAGLEELRLLYASLNLDPRITKDATDVHSEYAGQGELEVVNNTAPETLDHVEEADELLDKVFQPKPEENVLPNGQASVSSNPPRPMPETIRNTDLPRIKGAKGEEETTAVLGSGVAASEQLWEPAAGQKHPEQESEEYYLNKDEARKDDTSDALEGFRRLDHEVTGDEADPVVGEVEDFPLPASIEKMGPGLARLRKAGRVRLISLSDDGLTQCAVGVVVQGGKVLFGRKDEDDESDLAGKMVLPGGHVEAGESPVKAASREVFEETGVWAKPLKEIHVEKKDGNEVHFFEMESMNSDPSDIPGGEVDDVLSEVDYYDPAEVDTIPLNTQLAQQVLGKADMSAMMQGPDVEKAQQATGQMIADALWSGFGKAMEEWGGEPFLESRLTKAVRLGPRLEQLAGDGGAEVIRKELDRVHAYERYVPASFIDEVILNTTLLKERGWQQTDGNSGLWDHHGGGSIVVTDHPEDDDQPQPVKDMHPNGDSGRALEQTVSKGSSPVAEQRQHFPVPTTFQDGPGPSEGPEESVETGSTKQLVKSTPNVVNPLQDETFQDGARGQSKSLQGHGPVLHEGDDKSGSEHIMKAPGEDGMASPTHLVAPESGVSVAKNAKGQQQAPRGTGAAEQDQRGGDINPLNLAQGDEDVRALGRMWKSLARQAISDPTIRLTFMRRAADGSEYEITVDD